MTDSKETKPEESKPEESKPEESKPEEAKPEEAKHEEPKPSGKAEKKVSEKMSECLDYNLNPGPLDPNKYDYLLDF